MFACGIGVPGGQASTMLDVLQAVAAAVSRMGDAVGIPNIPKGLGDNPVIDRLRLDGGSAVALAAPQAAASVLRGPFTQATKLQYVEMRVN